MDREEPLRIAFVCDPIGDHKAGSIVSTRRFARRLVAQGHHVIFIGARMQGEGDTVDDIPTYRFRSVPLPQSGGWRLALPTVRELKRVFRDEGITVVHIIMPMTGAIVAVKAARALDIKIIAHSHSQPENLFMGVPRLLGRAFLFRSWNRYLAWLYRKAETVIYPSKLGHELLHHLTSEDKPYVIISNGIDVSEFRAVETGDFKDRYGIPQDAETLLFVGRLFPEKSVDTIIKAVPHIIKEHPRAHVMLVGGGHLRDKLEALATQLGVRDRITFLGRVSDADKLLAYNAADVFVLPSHAELEGMVVLDAMACGKPIIVSDSPMSASRYFVDGNGALFKTGDHEDLARQAVRLLKDPALRAAMGRRSIERSKEYDIARSAELLKAVYRGTVEGL